MSNFIYENFLVLMGLAILVTIGFAVFLVSKADDVHDQFMAECQEDHKHYECVAMWRAGRADTTMVPIPIVIPR